MGIAAAASMGDRIEVVQINGVGVYLNMGVYKNIQYGMWLIYDSIYQARNYPPWTIHC